MKTTLQRWMGKKIARWGMLGALLLGATATVGWMNQRQYQLGGGWIGSNGAGHTWNALQIPLDPSGRTMGLRVSNLATDAANAGLLAALGADTASDAIGQGAMISRDTAKWSMIGYAQANGNPIQARGILRYSGTLTFNGPDAYALNFELEVFLPSADADLDGYPDAGAVPILTIPGLTGFGKRVPIP